MEIAMYKTLGTIALALCGTAAYSQSLIELPEASPRAALTQRIGLTDLTIVYHRPLVNSRKVWGGLVPYNEVWRAGANENTTFQVSDDVAVEGQALPRGTYGLHMIPGTDSWTVIFSKNSTSWGSFSYDKAEDALRVTVKPEPAEMHEALTYDIDQLKPDSARVTLAWEKVMVPFRVAVDPQQTVSKVRNEVRGGMQYYWEGMAEAANYCLTNKVELEEGLKWADRSVAQEDRLENQMIRAGLLTALNRPEEAKAAKAHGLEQANVTQLYFYARGLQFQKKPDEAMEIFQKVSQKYPEHWLGHMSQARLASSKGDYDKALAELKTVETLGIPEQQRANLANLMKKLENHVDIN
jgi:hypothetical protein